MRETADPSTSLRFGRDDKGRGVTQVEVVAGWRETADPSTSLRFGRDDKGRGVTQVEVVAGWEKLQPSSALVAASQAVCNFFLFSPWPYL